MKVFRRWSIWVKMVPLATFIVVLLSQSLPLCSLCWKEALWLMERRVKKLLLIPQETLCTRGRLCASNLKQIAVAILEYYVPEHNGFLPHQEGWERQIGSYIKNDFVFRCLDANPSQKRFYRMNPKLSGKRLRDVKTPEKTVLIFECDDSGRPVARHHFLEIRHCCHVVFVDGRIGHMTARQVERLLWGR